MGFLILRWFSFKGFQISSILAVDFLLLGSSFAKVFKVVSVSQHLSLGSLISRLFTAFDFARLWSDYALASGSPASAVKVNQIFTAGFPEAYEPPLGGDYFEVNDDSPGGQDDINLFDYTVDERVNDFVTADLS
ncbi:hypothetical protein SSX86_003938 [Deinandra increscens subsp. villosa]|uniref:Uncharacterized protein n=1 Tax=Deinandra increscens subsp. villosa TaxID=3103831 RepID=A0AAP0H8J0_9ASTR